MIKIRISYNTIEHKELHHNTIQYGRRYITERFNTLTQQAESFNPNASSWQVRAQGPFLSNDSAPSSFVVQLELCCRLMLAGLWTAPTSNRSSFAKSSLTDLAAWGRPWEIQLHIKYAVSNLICNAIYDTISVSVLILHCIVSWYIIVQHSVI